MSDLSDITIAITSFWRRGYLAECMRHISVHLPEAELIVADDGDEQVTAGSRYDWDGITSDWTHIRDLSGNVEHRQQRHTWIQLPFDSGLSQKRNAIVRAARTPFTLLFCDDFKADEECRAGVLKLLEVLNQHCYIDVACGRVDNRAYEANLDYVPGHYIRETRFIPPTVLNPYPFLAGAPTANEHPNPGQIKWWSVDLAVNYFLARTLSLVGCPWNEQIGPIGGEHCQFYLDAKLKGYKVVWVPGVNVKTLSLGPEAQDPRYPAMRARAYDTGHAAMKRHYAIKEFIGMNGDRS